MESVGTPTTTKGSHHHQHMKLVIGELTRGRQMADQLLSMLRSQTNLLDHGRDMVEKILGTFTDSLSILQQQQAKANNSEVMISQIHNSNINPLLLPPKPQEDSGDCCKTKDRRGSYKRRKTSDSWTKDTPTLLEDGHAWRKYGQKTILNTNHPRNYFRCTHKYDQLCQATKQVQKIQEDPTIFRTIYHGHHTCKKFTTESSSTLLPLMDSTPDHPDSSTIWNFQTPTRPQLLDNVYNMPAQLMKHERAISSSSLQQSSHDVSRDDQDYFVSPNFDQFNTFDTSVPHLSAFSSGSEHGDVISSSDVYSCTTSTVPDDGIDMESIMDFGRFTADHFNYN